MSGAAIRRLRRQIILAAMLAVFLVMLFIGLLVNLLNEYVTQREIRWSLDWIIESQGEPDEAQTRLEDLSAIPSVVQVLTPSFRQDGYYVLTYDEDGALTGYHSNRSGDTSAEIQGAARRILAQGRKNGQYSTLYYRSAALEDGGTILAILDGTAVIYTRMRLLYASSGVGLLGLLITFLLVWKFSDKLIAPEVENSRRQEQFLTNASHELKTPLAVIRANTEMEELLHGEDEWTQSTLGQVDRMNGLIQNLVMITRSQEQEETVSEIDVTAAVAGSVKPFEAMAKPGERTLESRLEEGIRLRVNESRIRQLCTLLVDNAFKYCDTPGMVRVVLESVKKGKGIRLTVSNTYAEGGSVDVTRFFERFYREDASHNIDQGGYGIGLNIAQQFCEQMDGSIRAEWKDGEIRFVCLAYARR